jgi:superfamily II DNA or RNA helicase
MAMTRRSLARLLSWFLIVEDPQRRLTAQAIVTLAHQASVVQHIVTQPSLKRVLLADEVGLGKTVEAGLLIRHVLEQNPGARILYLAPARLVRNVRTEFDRLDLQFRSWVASGDRDATLSDRRVIASIHRAAHEGRVNEVLAAPAWDMIVVDECHHLSDWQLGGGKPMAQYRLVEKLSERLSEDARLLLMSGTPHQGHAARFKNILRLLQRKNEPEEGLAGRVIYRTKDDVADWDSRPLFPRRQVKPPLVVDLGRDYQAWLARILAFFEPDRESADDSGAQRRAAGWRAGQALQWATSSVQAGLGYLIRQAVRAKQGPTSLPALNGALSVIRPYRMGSVDEPISELWTRIVAEVDRQLDAADLEDVEEMEDDGRWRPDPNTLNALLETGVKLLQSVGDAKWDAVWARALEAAGDEKVVLFAQPIETVTAVAAFLKRKTGKTPALIIGKQGEKERDAEVASFWDPKGPQFLVSSRAGGEGINLQVARRLVHLDVPWNPMDLEQRIGRVHRFMSRKTILVDTVVAKDSREVDTYEFARQKLRTIASTLVPEDKFESLFSRVMALVPPEELQDVLVQGPVGPLSADDEKRLTELVTQGFEQWQTFHKKYSAQRNQITSLDPGAAKWEDLSQFAKTQMSASQAQGYTALRFVWDEGEVREASHDADVLSIDGKDYASGDYGGMPVTRDDGGRAERLGTNVGAVSRALRACAFPDLATGAAHLRWPDGVARPMNGTFGVLVVARQTVRSEQGSFAEQAASLTIALVGRDGAVRRVEPDARGEMVRTLIQSVIRREPEDDAVLLAAILSAESEFCASLRRPNEEERAAGLFHAVTPLLAAVVA